MSRFVSWSTGRVKFNLECAEVEVLDINVTIALTSRLS